MAKPNTKTKYLMSIKFNDEEKIIKTNDLAQSFLELRPQRLKTKVILKVKEGKKEIEKAFNPFQARRMWNAPLATRMILTRLILK